MEAFGRFHVSVSDGYPPHGRLYAGAGPGGASEITSFAPAELPHLEAAVAEIRRRMELYALNEPRVKAMIGKGP